MKKLFTMFIVASLALTIQAQDITNELGSDGHFYLNNSNSQNLIDFKGGDFLEPSLYQFKNAGSESTILQIINAGHNAKLEFNKSKGTASAPEDVTDGDALGSIDGQGYYNGLYREGGRISFNVKTDYGPISSISIPTYISFSTSNGTTPLQEVMRIQGDGKVGIGTIDVSSTLDVNGSMSLAINSGAANYLLTENDYTYITNNSAVNSANVILPTATGIQGRVYIVKNTGSANQLLWAQTGEFIDGAVNVNLVQWQFVKIQSDGSNWIVIGESN